MFPLSATKEIRQAEVYVWKDRLEAGDGTGKSYRGVLVLCPGQNGSSKELLREKDWQDFTRREKLALAGFQFVSDDGVLKDGRGYFVAERGSGMLLEKGLQKAGLGKLPVFLYGFSGGAHFAMSFAAWKPERVEAFCAYSFAWWRVPPANLVAPALVACGQADGERYGSSLAYFQAGRKQGKPWTWVSLEGQTHQASKELDEFVRSYFSAVLKARRLSGSFDEMVNNMTEQVSEKGERKDVGVSVLPSAGLLTEWRKLHHP